jgi:hypothetical protein
MHRAEVERNTDAAEAVGREKLQNRGKMIQTAC